MKPRGIRVIAGSARGRRLTVPPGSHTRPTKDIVREALFSALDARDALDDATVVDLYAGSGALGIEALSRGAARAVFVESDPKALTAIRANIEALGWQDRSRVVAGAAERFLQAGPPAEAPFDLALCDPPYDTADDAVTALLGWIFQPGWLADDAIVSVERPVRHPVLVPDGCTNGWERAFGDTLVSLCWR
ncbi:MAG TPA: 16S rRNA (guanine(966)-N(2))-methyltransferase RsmD [Acidimicrobiia bacterium]|nr:16S rRNA (guanine(966)-N(2))-methyltransferase RsmD [Acidimicrobiia bacterium]